MGQDDAVEKKRKEKTTPFGVNLMRSQVLYRAAQGDNGVPLSRSTEGSACSICSATSHSWLICSASRKNLLSSEGFHPRGFRNSRSTICRPRQKSQAKLGSCGPRQKSCGPRQKSQARHGPCGTVNCYCRHPFQGWQASRQVKEGTSSTAAAHHRWVYQAVR